MDLKSILPGLDQKENKEHFWSVVIEPGWVECGIWKITDGKAEIVATSPSTSWDQDEELIKATDAALSSCIQNLADEIPDPKKTVFGVVSSWVEKGEIKGEFLDKVKRICTDLALTPAGFVVLPEAVSHLIKSTEGSPLTGIVVGVFAEEIEVSLFSLGTLSGSVAVSRSVSFFDDVVEGLSRFVEGAQNLPSRIILYDGKDGDLEDARQELIKADWDGSEALKFLHTPKIEILTAHEKVSAVSLAGASEMGEVTGLYKTDDKPTVFVGEEHNNLSSDTAFDAGEVGFVLGEDVSEVSADDSQEESGEFELPEMEQSSGKEFESSQHDFSESQKEVVDNVDTPKPVSRFPRPSFNLKTLTQKLNPFAHLPKVHQLGPASHGKKIFMTGFIVFLVIAIGALVAYWFLPKAEVTIFVSSKRLEDKYDLTVDPNVDSLDLENKVLPGEIFTQVYEGERTKSTTGTKTVGEKAIGEVTLYRVGTQVDLTAGTVIEGPNDLNFTLDENVTIASGSASQAGETKAKVTAADIGAEYNFAGGTTFTVSGYSKSDIEAKSSDSFSGGSSREISAVSEDDQEVLKESLIDELLEKAKSEFTERAGSDKLFAEGSLESSEQDVSFSNKVGDEATTLKLGLKLEVKSVFVDKKAMAQFAQEVLKGNVPSGFVLRDDQISSEFNYEGKEGDAYTFSTRIIANLLPSLDPDAVSKNIAGKYPAGAKEYLVQGVPGFSRAEIIFTPKLPGKLSTLPHISKNISIQITAER